MVMGEPVTQSQFYAEMTALRNEIAAQGASFRRHLGEESDKVLAAFFEHEKTDREVADRVLTIETERGIEKQIASRHGAIAGSIAAALILMLIEAAKKALGH